MHLRPGADARRLLPRQRAELVVLDITTGQTQVIWEARELFEAPNWTLDGMWFYNGISLLAILSKPAPSETPGGLGSTEA